MVYKDVIDRERMCRVLYWFSPIICINCFKKVLLGKLEYNAFACDYQKLEPAIQQMNEII